MRPAVDQTRIVLLVDLKARLRPPSEFDLRQPAVCSAFLIWSKRGRVLGRAHLRLARGEVHSRLVC